MSNVIIALFADTGWERAAQGVAGAGRALADQLGSDLNAVVLGAASEELKSGLAKVANKVIVAEAVSGYQPDVALAALEQICGGLTAKAILFSNDTYSQELVPRLAHRLGGSSMADGIDLKADGDKVHVARMAYGGKAVSVYKMNAEPAVVWVRARALPPAEGVDVAGSIETATVDLPEPRIEITGRQVEETEGVRLEDAQVIVSGGRGLGGPEPFENELKALADAIGGVQGASRAACDAGWVPPSWQVGQTGKKVAPELYIAIAISGASQHLLGMGDSKVICAINTDRDAPIFKHCSFGIVEDYKNVVAPLTERLSSS